MYCPLWLQIIYICKLLAQCQPFSQIIIHPHGLISPGQVHPVAELTEGFFAVLAALGKVNVFRTHEVSHVRATLAALGALTGES